MASAYPRLFCGGRSKREDFDRAFPLEPVADFQGNPLPTDDTKSAATLITLSTGVYTVVVTSADGGEGDVLVEAYEVY